MRLGIKSSTATFLWPLLLFQSSYAFYLVPQRTLSRVKFPVKPQACHHPTVVPLQMVKSISPAHGTMKMAGPLDTQVGDLSVKNIQRVGETAFGAMFLVAAIQGALVSSLIQKSHQ
jgi:hypothetical protein